MPDGETDLCITILADEGRPRSYLPAILFLILLEGMIATSPVIFLFTWKSKVNFE